jgi:hypothetical protein
MLKTNRKEEEKICFPLAHIRALKLFLVATIKSQKMLET